MRCPSCYAPVSDDDQACPSCGKSLSLWNPPAGNPAARQPFDAGAVSYAGFWKRFAAYIVDSVVLVVATVVLMIPVVFITGFDEAVIKDNETAINLVSFVGGLLYFALMESSEQQATLGKQLLGIRVSRLNGERLTLARAIGRYAGKLLSFVTLFIGFIMAGFTARKQALHDLITDTVVVNDPAAGPKTGCMLVIIFFALIVPIGLVVVVASSGPLLQQIMEKAAQDQQALEQDGGEEMAPALEPAPEEEPAPQSAPGAAEVAAHADMVAAAVSSHARAYSALPASLEEVSSLPAAATGAATPLVSYVADPGELTISSRDGVVILVMTAVVGGDGMVVWSCRGENIEPKQFPSRCAAW